MNNKTDRRSTAVFPAIIRVLVKSAREEMQEKGDTVDAGGEWEEDRQRKTSGVKMRMKG